MVWRVISLHGLWSQPEDNSFPTSHPSHLMTAGEGKSGGDSIALGGGSGSALSSPCLGCLWGTQELEGIGCLDAGIYSCVCVCVVDNWLSGDL